MLELAPLSRRPQRLLCVTQAGHRDLRTYCFSSYYWNRRGRLCRVQRTQTEHVLRRLGETLMNVERINVES